MNDPNAHEIDPSAISEPLPVDQQTRALPPMTRLPGRLPELVEKARKDL